MSEMTRKNRRRISFQNGLSALKTNVCSPTKTIVVIINMCWFELPEKENMFMKRKKKQHFGMQPFTHTQKQTFILKLFS